MASARYSLGIGTVIKHTAAGIFLGQKSWAARRLFQRRSDVGFFGLLGCRLLAQECSG